MKAYIRKRNREYKDKIVLERMRKRKQEIIVLRGPFPLGKSAGGVKLTTPLYTEPKIRKNGAIPRLYTHFHGVVLTEIQENFISYH
jgi:hypothetical protein